METTLTPPSPTQTLNDPTRFSIGDEVIYGLHGRCIIKGIESKTLQNATVSLYHLEVAKSPLARGNRNQPQIWVPVQQAVQNGLRAAITKDQITDVYSLLGDREHYFPLDRPWRENHAAMERSIKRDGIAGLAKAVSFSFVLKNRSVVPSSEVLKFNEQVTKLLAREISETLGEPIGTTEAHIEELLRRKLKLDQ